MEFALSKLFWLIAQPANLSLLTLLAATLLLLAGRRRAGMTLVVLLALSALVISTVPIGAWLLRPLEERFARVEPVGTVDGIIVLGGAVEPRITAVRGEAALNGAAERMVAFVALARRHPRAALVFAGGSGVLWDQQHKEAMVARRLLRDLGLGERPVAYEDASRNTRENGVNAMALVKPRTGERWLLVTSARQMPRAVGVFRKIGWDVVAYPTDYLTAGDEAVSPWIDLAGGVALLTAGLREWIGLAWYRLRGWSDAVFPA